MRLLVALALLVGVLVADAAAAKAPTLTLTLGNKTQRFTAAQLLARPDAATIKIPSDPSYGRSMSYRAVPLLALLGKTAGPSFDTLEAKATDGFVAQIPLSLVREGATGGSVAWIAVENPLAPWPPLGGKPASAGPFYLVWTDPERSGVGGEQWPYQLASLTAIESPAARWPQMAVGTDAPDQELAQRGQEVFTAQCLPCHRMKGAGGSNIGPDLGMPMNPTQYLTPDGLRQLIRDPKAVRTWPQQAMPGFDEEKLPDVDLDALVTYLTYMAETR